MVAKKKTIARKPSRKKTSKTTKSKSKSKTTKGKKKPFGGYAINFAGRKETVEQVFGKKPIPPSEMTKKIWAFVKSKKLSTS